MNAVSQPIQFQTLKFTIFFLFCSANVAPFEFTARSNTSSLCSRSLRHSCSHQLKNSDENSECHVQTANSTNPHLCPVGNFAESGSFLTACRSEDGCGLGLEVYRHALQLSVPFYRTALNLSLTDLDGKAFVRYSASDFSFCLNISANLSSINGQSMWYDCLFHGRDFESQSFRLEYRNGGRYGLFAFQMPTGIEKLTKFNLKID